MGQKFAYQGSYMISVHTVTSVRMKTRRPRSIGAPTDRRTRHWGPKTAMCFHLQISWWLDTDPTESLLTATAIRTIV